MKGTLAVAAREIVERKLLFLGAFVAGLLPFGTLLPTFRGNANDVRSVAVLLLTITIAVALPIVFGATILAADIAQKRLGFYFSRPLPAISIWAGKLLGAILICIGCILLAAAPVLFLDGMSAFSFAAAGPAALEPLVSTLLGILLLFLFAHAVASMARLRSVWIVLDFFLAVFFAVAVAFCVRSLFLSGFWDLDEVRNTPDRALWWLPVVLVAILLAASYVQVADGRTDARRSHGALSATLWGLTALFAANLGGLAWWAASARATDLARINGNVLTAPRGPWVALGGPLRAGRGAGMFLFDTEGGRSLRIRSGVAAFSANGARAAWGEDRLGFFERNRKAEVFVADLSSAKAIETGLTCGEGWCRVVLSPSGRRLALVDERSVTAYDVANPENPKQLAAFRLEVGSRALAFLDEDTIRIFPRIFNPNRKGITPAEAEISELSLPSKKSHVSGRLEREALAYLRMSADGRYFVGTSRSTEDPQGRQVLTLHDGRTGAALRVLDDGLKGARALFLSGGRIAVAGFADGKGVLKIFLEGENTPSQAAEPVRSIDLGLAATLVLGGEVAPGRIAVALNPFQGNDPRSQSAWKLAFVDVATGAVSPVADGLFPANRSSWWFSPVLPPAEASSPASKLFLDASGALVRLDPATGKQEILVRGRR